ncbi:MAG: XTP/dITP diphosphatase [Deltaproteobacteria bacterium]|jgi:XTP/dITP diphosphohydrolase|nr:XTP/dITP diphosphatase [Deltaproteobacteria bacterium]MBW2534252.1 XTP/dITP diphosphatase [Deltaproteobacteria bacterium]
MTSSKIMSIVVATTNPGKLTELRALLEDLPVEVLTVADVLGHVPPVVEDGETFEANAQKKAREIANATQMVTLADDSGLEVDALGGRPGVRSARFAGEGATDAENNAALLDMMQEVEDGQRSARFRCTIALCDPWAPDRSTVVAGRCEGSIARNPSGAGGFGYDPLFIVSGLDRTMAELSPEEKNRISHRARALEAIRPMLEALVGQRIEDAARIVQPAAG